MKKKFSSARQWADNKELNSNWFIWAILWLNITTSYNARRSPYINTNEHEKGMAIFKLYPYNMLNGLELTMRLSFC